MGKEAVGMLCPLPQPLSPPQIQLANKLKSFFVLRTFSVQRNVQTHRGQTRRQPGEKWGRKHLNTSPSHSWVAQFQGSFHIISQRVSAGFLPTLTWTIDCSTSSVSTPTSGLPVTVTTFIQICESGSAFKVTHSKIELAFPGNPGGTICISEDILSLEIHLGLLEPSSTGHQPGSATA